MPCEPSAQVQLVLELLPEVPVAPLVPEVLDGSVDEPEVAVLLPVPDGDVPLIPDPLVAAGSLLPEVALLPIPVLLPPDVMPLPEVPPVVPYVLPPEVVGSADVPGSVVDAPLVLWANAIPPAPSMEMKIAMGNFFI